jgi:HEAT repeat protein
MISDADLLFIEPWGLLARWTAVCSPRIDHLTRQMTAAFRAAQPSTYAFGGVHKCVCGAHSSNCDYFLPDGQKTNSLCVHYLAYHRRAVPKQQLARVAALPYGEADPSEDELRGRRWHGNRPGDFFGRERLAAFAEGGLDLAAAYLAAEAAPRAHEYFHQVLTNLRMMPRKSIPTLIEAICHADGEVSRWATRAFWPEGWKETWIAPLLMMLRSTDSEIRLWAVQTLGQIGDTHTTWTTFSAHERKDFRANGFSSPQGTEVGAALLQVMLSDPDELVRSGAVRAIENIGPQAEVAVSALVEVVQKSNQKEQRIAAIQALASIGPQAQGTAFLLDLLTDPDGQIPWRVLEALGPRSPWIPQVIPVLIAALKDGAKKIRSRAVAMLMRLGPEASRIALPALREALRDEDPHVQSHAREAVRLIESREPGRYNR